jgi:uncharacterized cupredoxin-like copper-binding protein/glucose/arabinose dehydrogenase
MTTISSNNTRTLKYLFILAGCLSFSGVFSQGGETKVQKEEDFYKIYTLPIPKDIALEVGGMTFTPNDELVVCTRHGEVWSISNPYMINGTAPRYRLIARGLHEPLGINYIYGDLYVVQRSELTRLRDLNTDRDGEMEEYETIYSFPQAGNYHEFSYGPVLDRDSNMIVALNLGYTDSAVSLSKWHGWMLKITPEGKMTPFATGMRSPAAFALNSAGDIFYSENQGEWVGSGSITEVEKGDFMGHPQGLKWADFPGSPVKARYGQIPNTGEPKYEVAKRVPGLKTPSVWFPQTILGISTSGILNYNHAGKMGPFNDQLFVGDQGQSKIMRVALEKVKGVYQGVVFPFREGFNSGILRMNWGSDGSMFVGMTSRGWGSTGPQEFGLQRLEWNGKIPFEMKTIKAMPDGFELEFTQPVDEKSVKDVNGYRVTSFTYKYHNSYGSATIDQLRCNIKAIEVSDDKLRVRLVVDSLKEGYIHEIVAEGARSAEQYSLMHNVGYYTLNKIPDGNKLAITGKNKVKAIAAMNHQAMNMKAAKETSTAKTSVKVSQSKHQTMQPASWTNGPEKTILITPIPGLKFSITNITVKAGTKVKLTFRNTDDMLHNFVVTLPESADFVGAAALKMGLNGEQNNYVPDMNHVLFHTLLLQPGKSDTIYFTAPDKPGDYQYVCTYPGHYLLMRGLFRVLPK